MRKYFGIGVAGLMILLIAEAGLAAGIASKVVAVDQKHQQLWLDWDNGTKKSVSWNAKTKFSILETGGAAKPEDIHVGSYLRIQGDEKNGKFFATAIVIWQAESDPAPK